MAERRMFAKSIIDSDLFLDMPSSTQNLYFHLGMRADDDGFVNSPQKIMRSVSCSRNDMDMLVFKNFVIPFETGVCVITHWKIHNYLRNDRYRPTIYTDEKNLLSLDESKSYVLGVRNGIPLGIPQDIPVGDVGKVRLGKVSIDKENICDADASPPIKTIPPILEDVKAYCEERSNNVDPDKWYDHYTAKGWMVGKTKMKDWKAAVRTWERNSRGSSAIARTGQASRQEPNYVMREFTAEELEALPRG